jgi:hypothetical protein
VPGAARARDDRASVAPAQRTSAFARYSLIGALSMAAGALAAAAPDARWRPASASSPLSG